MSKYSFDIDIYNNKKKREENFTYRPPCEEPAAIPSGQISYTL